MFAVLDVIHLLNIRGHSMYNFRFLSVFFFFMLAGSQLLAELRIDVATGKAYSIPASPEVNQEEYNQLFKELGKFYDAMKKECAGKEEAARKTIIFLEMIGTPTALRLISDLRGLGQKIHLYNL